MKSAKFKPIFFGFALLVALRCTVLSNARPDETLNAMIVSLPTNVSINIPNTGTALDGGSIINDLAFSNGKRIRLLLNTPFAISTDEYLYKEIHFTLYSMPDRSRRETLEHGSPAERRLIELLKGLIDQTSDLHQKKNASSLINFLQNRNQPFSVSHEWWDFTPWEVPTPSANEIENPKRK